MKKNVAGQVVGAQLVSKTDGSAVTTGTTTVYVTGDGGTQAAGSVGAGACTHEGQGFWTYAPAQAETNYDHVAFTFVNTSAVNATVQIYPSFPQTGDNFARLGAPAGASVSADVAAIKAETASIQTDTNDIQTRIPAALVSGRMDSSVGAMSAAAVQAIWDALTSALTTVGSIGKLLVDNINATISSRLAAASYTAPLDAAGTRAAVGLAAANLDTQLDALPTAAENADAVWDEVLAGHLTAGSTGAALNAAGSAGDPWSTALPGAYGAGTAGKIVGDNLNATISSRLAAASYTAPLDAAGTRAAVGLASANLDTQLDALPTAAENADAVWDEALAGHAAAGSTGEALSNASAAGDPWATTLPGAYGAGTAGKIVGDNLNATVSSRLPTASYTAPLDAAGTRSAVGLASANLDTQIGTLATAANLATVAGYLDTEIAAILADTNELQTDWVNGGRLDLLIDGIKSKTDALPASPAATGDIPTAAQNADKLLGRNLAGGSDGGRTVQDALRPLRNKTSIAAGTMTVTLEDDLTTAWTAAVTTAPGDPLTSIDPA